MRILLVEDEQELAHWLCKALARQSGFVVEWVGDGLSADRMLVQERFAAVILDMGLPHLPGAQVLARMRARDDRTPVLVLTARDSLSNRVSMLQEGADDFLPKPFDLAELEARIQALVRRSRGREFARLSCADLSLDLSSQRFTIGSEPLALTPREYVILRALIQRSGEPLSKQFILDRVVSSEADINLEAIEVAIHRLRKKLAGTQVQIITMRGLGYCLEPLEPDTGTRAGIV